MRTSGCLLVALVCQWTETIQNELGCLCRGSNTIDPSLLHAVIAPPDTLFFYFSLFSSFFHRFKNNNQALPAHRPLPPPPRLQLPTTRHSPMAKSLLSDPSLHGSTSWPINTGPQRELISTPQDRRPSLLRSTRSAIYFSGRCRTRTRRSSCPSKRTRHSWKSTSTLEDH